MPKYIITVWETREYTVPVEAPDLDEAKEIALEDYIDDASRDCFVSSEVRDVVKCEIDAPPSGAKRRAAAPAKAS